MSDTDIKALRDLLARATQQTLVVEFDPPKDSDITTVAWVASYCIGFRSGIPGGNYRDDLHGDEAADAALLAAARNNLPALLDRLEAQERRVADLSAALTRLLSALDKEASASMTWENAKQNFSTDEPELLAFTKATVAAASAMKVAHKVLDDSNG